MIAEAGSEDICVAVQARVASTVQKTGISGKLKSELRFRLIKSLQHEASGRHPGGGTVGEDVAPAMPTDPPRFAERALVSLVLEFLRSKGKVYALSVLLPECGMTDADVLTHDEVGGVLGLQRVPLFAACCASDSGSIVSATREVDSAGGLGERSLLERVFAALAASSEPLRATAGTQTDGGGVGQDLESKLRACEVPAAAALERDRRTMEERMLQFQARCEARCRKEADMEIARVRTIERERVALEESAKCRADMQQVVLKVEREAREREQRLHAKEAAALERLRTKELVLEKRGVEWRAEAQRLLDAGTQRQHTRSQRVEVEEQRLAAFDHALGRREREIVAREARIDDQFSALKAENAAEMQRWKAEVDGNFVADREALRQRELVIEREGVWREREKDQFEAAHKQLLLTERTAEETQAALRVAEEKLAGREREVADSRWQLNLLTENSHKAQLEADRSRGELGVLQREVEALHAQRAALQQSEGVRQHAVAKAQAASETQAQTLEQANTRFLAELERERARLKRMETERDEVEARTCAGLERAWELERGSLSAEVERLRQICAEATAGESAVQARLRRAEEQHRAARRDAEELRLRLTREAEECQSIRQRLAEAERAKQRRFTQPQPQAEVLAAVRALEEELLEVPVVGAAGVRGSGSTRGEAVCRGQSPRRIGPASQALLLEDTLRLENEIQAFVQRAATPRNITADALDSAAACLDCLAGEDAELDELLAGFEGDCRGHPSVVMDASPWPTTAPARSQYVGGQLPKGIRAALVEQAPWTPSSSVASAPPRVTGAPLVAAPAATAASSLAGPAVPAPAIGPAAAAHPLPARAAPPQPATKAHAAAPTATARALAALAEVASAAAVSASTALVAPAPAAVAGLPGPQPLEVAQILAVPSSASATKAATPALPAEASNALTTLGAVAPGFGTAAKSVASTSSPAPATLTPSVGASANVARTSPATTPPWFQAAQDVEVAMVTASASISAVPVAVAPSFVAGPCSAPIPTTRASAAPAKMIGGQILASVTVAPVIAASSPPSAKIVTVANAKAVIAKAAPAGQTPRTAVAAVVVSKAPTSVADARTAPNQVAVMAKVSSSAVTPTTSIPVVAVAKASTTSRVASGAPTPAIAVAKAVVASVPVLAAAPSPAPAQPAAQPVDDVLADSVDDASAAAPSGAPALAAERPVDDMFADSIDVMPDAAPSTTPEPAAEWPVDDMFADSIDGMPAAPPTPLVPATERPVDDMFADSIDDMPAAAPPTPLLPVVERPVENMCADSFDNASAAAQERPVDDMFADSIGDTSAAAAPSAPTEASKRPADDIFANPIDHTTTVGPPVDPAQAAGQVDDMFVEDSIDEVLAAAGRAAVENVGVHSVSDISAGAADEAPARPVVDMFRGRGDSDASGDARSASPHLAGFGDDSPGQVQAFSVGSSDSSPSRQRPADVSPAGGRPTAEGAANSAKDDSDHSASDMSLPSLGMGEGSSATPPRAASAHTAPLEAPAPTHAPLQPAALSVATPTLAAAPAATTVAAPSVALTAASVDSPARSPARSASPASSHGPPAFREGGGGRESHRGDGSAGDDGSGEKAETVARRFELEMEARLAKAREAKQSTSPLPAASAPAVEASMAEDSDLEIFSGQQSVVGSDGSDAWG